MSGKPGDELVSGTSVPTRLQRPIGLAPGHVFAPRSANAVAKTAASVPPDAAFAPRDRRRSQVSASGTSTPRVGSKDGARTPSVSGSGTTSPRVGGLADASRAPRLGHHIGAFQWQRSSSAPTSSTAPPPVPARKIVGQPLTGSSGISSLRTGNIAVGSSPATSSTPPAAVPASAGRRNSKEGRPLTGSSGIASPRTGCRSTAVGSTREPRRSCPATPIWNPLTGSASAVGSREPRKSSPVSSTNSAGYRKASPSRNVNSSVDDAQKYDKASGKMQLNSQASALAWTPPQEIHEDASPRVSSPRLASPTAPPRLNLEIVRRSTPDPQQQSLWQPCANGQTSPPLRETLAALRASVIPVPRCGQAPRSVLTPRNATRGASKVCAVDAKAIKRIQVAFRDWRACRIPVRALSSAQGASRCIQRWWRMVRCKRRLQVILARLWWRMMLHVLQDDKSAQRIQSGFRMLRLRVRFRLVGTSVPKLQKWWRGVYVRNALRILRAAVLRLQRWRHRYLARRCLAAVRSVAQRVRSAARLVQSRWRGFKARQRYSKDVLQARSAARLVQSRWRGFKARQRYSKEIQLVRQKRLPVRKLPSIGEERERRRRGIVQPTASGGGLQAKSGIRSYGQSSTGATHRNLGIRGYASALEMRAAAAVETAKMATSLPAAADGAFSPPLGGAIAPTPRVGSALAASGSSYTPRIRGAADRLISGSNFNSSKLLAPGASSATVASMQDQRSRLSRASAGGFNTSAGSIGSAPTTASSAVVTFKPPPAAGPFDVDVLLTDLMTRGLLSSSPQAPEQEPGGRSDLAVVRDRLAAALPQMEVRTILRVQTTVVSAAYQGVQSTLGPERLLWHGTSWDSVANIVRHGFNRGYGGRHGQKLGRGSYFAEDANYALRFCGRSTPTRAVFLAGVLPGRFCRGEEGLVEPPQADASGTRFDSTVDDAERPKVYCVFKDFQALPLYLAEVYLSAS